MSSDTTPLDPPITHIEKITIDSHSSIPTLGPQNNGSRLTQQQIASLSGASAGFISGVIVCPLDVAKTRFQAQGSFLRNLNSPEKLKNFEKFKYRGLLHSLQLIWKEEGLRGLYRGLVPITCGYFPTWMIYFSCYEGFKRKSSEYIKDDNLSYCLSAIAAGSISSTLTNPIWVVKTRIMLQMQNGKTIYDRFSTTRGSRGTAATPGGLKRQYYNGTFDAFKKMYKQEGIRSFYRGLLPSYFGLIHVAIQFPLYENLKKSLNIYPKDDDPNVNNTLNMSQFSKLVLASSLSKMSASVATYPHEIVRTRLQIVNSSAKKHTAGVIGTIISVYTTEGIRGFYSGFIVNLARTVPSSAVTLVLFEYFKYYLQKFA